MLLLATGASAGSSYTLHPAGFGPQSYAAWKAQQGLPDSTGSDNQALYFQKMTTTPTVAAGVAVIRGVAGIHLSDLTGLSWVHREDGHCGAGAPRWNVTYQDSSGNSRNLFLGCTAAQHQEFAVYGGHGWCQDTYSASDIQNQATMQGVTGNPTVTGLSIVFDEGNDEVNPRPAPCNQEPGTSGFVHLDDILVNIDGMTHCWTGASDNSNGGATTCPPAPPSSNAAATSLSFNVPTGLPVDPTDVGLVSALNLAYPGVPLTSWTLYPNVVP